METVTIFWYCGYALVTSSEFTEKDCETEFETKEDVNDWNAGQCEAVCPGCNRTLYQQDDHASLSG